MCPAQSKHLTSIETLIFQVSVESSTRTEALFLSITEVAGYTAAQIQTNWICTFIYELDSDVVSSSPLWSHALLGGMLRHRGS